MEGRGSNPRLLTAASSPHSEMSCVFFSSLFSFRLFSLPPPPLRLLMSLCPVFVQCVSSSEEEKKILFAIKSVALGVSKKKRTGMRVLSPRFCSDNPLSSVSRLARLSTFFSLFLSSCPPFSSPPHKQPGISKAPLKEEKFITLSSSSPPAFS